MPMKIGIKNPEHWHEVNEEAQANMVIARKAMIKYGARTKAQVVAEVGMKVILPVPKNSGKI